MNAGIGIDVCKKYLDVAEHGDRAVERFANSKAGIKLVVKWIAARNPVQILIEATGGYELEILKALVGVGLPAAQINPRQVRDFAKALGQLSKTDVLDARVLAHFAEVKMFPVYVPPTPEQYELSQCCLRREHIKKLKQAESQRLRCFADATILAAMRGLIKSFAKQIKALDKRMAQLVKGRPEATVLSTMKGVGPVLRAVLLSELPELGRIEGKAVCKLVGVAPLPCDSGDYKGQRKIWGGRKGVRDILYMASLTAAKLDPDLRDVKKRLRARGKLPKVAIVAVMHKMLVILNARMRDAIAQGLVPA
jgi:transposase